ncbi:MAG: hypothetical protein U9O78_01740 [Patescibacteria group bacterium]|nr:hypothetical protein [Patescibacteria group bacterium]
MNDFTKLLLFLGQQLYLYKRRIIFIEELRQIFSTDKKIEEVLKDPLEQGWIRPVGDEHHFEITKLAEANVLRHWNKNVYRTGEVGGGSIHGNPKDRRFTLTVEFDTPVKFVEHTQTRYKNKDIYLNCVEGFYYEAKIHVQAENEFEDAEESINRYLSHLSYHYKVPVSIRATHSGSIDISSTTRRPKSRSGIYCTIPTLPTLEEKQDRSLAFYRQFRNFSQIRTTESRYYQLMSLLKIIEGVSPSADLKQNKSDFITLVDQRLENLSTKLQVLARGVEEKYASKYNTVFSFSEIAWEHYRNGVTHWRARGNFLDPDIPDNTIATTINILEQIVIKILESNYAIPN